MPATKAEKKKEKVKVTPKKIEKKSSSKIPNQRTHSRAVWSDVTTHDGRRLTIKEAKFIDGMVEHGNMRQAAIEAGYARNSEKEQASQKGYALRKKSYIADEISYRLQALHEKTIANRQEIMQFWTDMMRGKILDQFDLPTTNADKLKAATELAKRSMDIEDRLNERKAATTNPEIKIALKWDDGK